MAKKASGKVAEKKPDRGLSASPDRVSRLGKPAPAESQPASAIETLRALRSTAGNRAIVASSQATSGVASEPVFQAKMAPEAPVSSTLESSMVQPADSDAKRRSDPLQSKETRSPSESGNRTGLPNRLKTGLEEMSGMDLSNVKVHYGSPEPKKVRAAAYARGSEIHLGPGQEKHLSHEGWHVVQQMQGRVRPTLQIKGAKINDDPGLEREADVMGARAAQGAEPLHTGGGTRPSAGRGVAQAIAGPEMTIQRGGPNEPEAKVGARFPVPDYAETEGSDDEDDDIYAESDEDKEILSCKEGGFSEGPLGQKVLEASGMFTCSGIIIYDPPNDYGVLFHYSALEHDDPDHPATDLIRHVSPGRKVYFVAGQGDSYDGRMIEDEAGELQYPRFEKDLDFFRGVLGNVIDTGLQCDTVEVTSIRRRGGRAILINDFMDLAG